MNKFALLLSLCALQPAVGCNDSAKAPLAPQAPPTARSGPQEAPAQAAPRNAQPHATAADSIPPGARRLMAAYPGQGIKYAGNRLVFADGTKIVYDDGVKKSFAQRLDNSDPEDMWFTPYDTASPQPAYLSDCGRSRSEQLFRHMYGQSAAAVAKRLVPVKWFGQTIRFTSVNNANRKLEAVAAELAKRPELRKYLTGASTFYWRKVRGADRLSAHSYGIAIDINTKYSDYWLWKYPKAGEEGRIGYHNRIPLDIVRAFERHGFVWGGRWYHFDTMHFEYRPELLP